jgi:hypothetical protein
MLSYVYSEATRKYRDTNLNYATIASFRILSNSLFTNHPIIPHHLFCTAERVVNQTVIRPK